MLPAPAPPRGRRSVVLRYAPFLAVIVTIVLVAVVFRDDNTSRVTVKRARAVERSSLPMTFAEAKARGVAFDGGPKCDPATGRMRIPSWYAAPCVEPWVAGVDNGGATWTGVTGDTITVVQYTSDPKLDPLSAAFLAGAGADLDPPAIAETAQGYGDLFNDHYELYGRHIKAETFIGTGASDDDVRAKADAITIAEEHKPFAVIGGPLQTLAFGDELAARGILCIGSCAQSPPDEFSERLDPYIWSDRMSTRQSALLSAELILKQLADKLAQWAGSEELARRKRVFGEVHYEPADGRYTGSHHAFLAALEKGGVRLAVDETYLLDFAKIQESARTIITKLQDKGVTTVVIAGDPIMPSYLTKEATSQGFFPEWVVSTSVLVDTTIFGRTYDQQQWQHAMGISIQDVPTPLALTESYRIYKWQFAKPPPSNTHGVIWPGALLLGNGLQLAGPDLTPETFKAGLFRYPVTGGSALSSTQSWGRHGLWPQLDRYRPDDVALLWWDPDATGPDETGIDGKGMLAYAQHGKRYAYGKIPTKPVGFFDSTTSVRMLDAVPPDDKTPSYPSPAG